MARPKIPQSQKEAVETIHEERTGFAANSFQEALSTVVNLAKESLDRYHTEQRGSFEIEINGSRSRITFKPTEASKLEFEHFAKGDPPQTAILDTGIAWIGQDTLEEEIEDIQDVETCYIAVTTGTIVVEYADGGEQPEIIAEKILYVLTNLIDSHEQLVLEGKKTRSKTKEDAIAPYWPQIRQSE
ncbi:hypothetical protein [Halobaculum sp. EA56]|uniref:hypothetical protein n=1 Tax=Halobaculum sp. EA56 TaxID=3421648 RepID=UPI003EBC2F92